MNVSQMYFIVLAVGGLRSPWLRSQVFGILNKELDGDRLQSSSKALLKVKAESTHYKREM
jgi:hypothetical protein